MNKKILALFCAVAAACSLSACGNNNQNSSSTASEPQSSSSAAESKVSSGEVKNGTEAIQSESTKSEKSNSNSTTANKPGNSTKTATVDSSSESPSKIETLPDGSILEVNGNTVSETTNHKSGKCTTTYVFDGDMLKSYTIRWTDIISKEAQSGLKNEEESLGFILTQIDDTSMTHIANETRLQKIRGQFTSKAELIQQIKDLAKSQTHKNGN